MNKQLIPEKMKTAEFNENYTIDRKARGLKATPKNAPAIPTTADGMLYDATATYYFFDSQTQQVRTSTGLRREGDYLSVFGLKVVAVSKLHINKDVALAEAQEFCRSQIENLQKRVADFELEKTNEARSLKTFLMAKE